MTMEDEIKSLRDQLDAARYAMERVRFHTYAEAVKRGELPRSELPKKMEAAMANYDGILAAAAAGTYGDVHAQKRDETHDYIAEYKRLIGAGR